MHVVPWTSSSFASQGRDLDAMLEVHAFAVGFAMATTHDYRIASALMLCPCMPQAEGYCI